ncbi:hypothetical protein RFI_06281 [Reticulomyxa filosa]|uniref:Uncharacterized protein n=1 Tax=Reticulomyxa filosa TaxID=46433 RepID=X6NY93_RETFI|nr:hypothetical protein RFI_06281 [Reticulomyxa filosa]|eukprot:ETO30838.1 hypothetical protein RFI_06281 [Reticulomyxa filosa]
MLFFQSKKKLCLPYCFAGSSREIKKTMSRIPDEYIERHKNRRSQSNLNDEENKDKKENKDLNSVKTTSIPQQPAPHQEDEKNEKEAEPHHHIVSYTAPPNPFDENEESQPLVPQKKRSLNSRSKKVWEVLQKPQISAPVVSKDTAVTGAKIGLVVLLLLLVIIALYRFWQGTIPTIWFQ